MPHWKSPGLDCIQGLWLKRFSILHQAIPDILKNELQSAESHPVFIQQDQTKGNAVGNYTEPLHTLTYFRNS